MKTIEEFRHDTVDMLDQHYNVMKQHNELIGLLNTKRKQHSDTLRQLGTTLNSIHAMLLQQNHRIEELEKHIREYILSGSQPVPIPAN